MNTNLKRILTLLAALGGAGLGEPALAQIIDHQTLASVPSLPQTTMDQIGKLRWYFIHASVGDNLMQGLRDLHNSNAVRYPLAASTIPTGSPPPATTSPGMVYEHHFSADKMPQFQTMVNSNGWCNPAVEIALMKFCYLDGLATSLTPALQLASQYVTMMQSLEQAHPGTFFVYVSMPLLIFREADDPRRDPNYLPSLVSINHFNDWLRDYCRNHNKLLYDVADIESHDPAGNQTTFVWTNGQSYAALYGPYVFNTTPGANSGHLIAPGRRQVALGWYAVAAAMVSNQISRPMLSWHREVNRVQITWSASGFTLQQNTNLAQPASWEDVFAEDQGSHTVTNDATPGKYFRLRR